jgi:hypothetical protein
MLLSVCRQELRDSPPGASCNFRKIYSHNSVTVSNIVLSAGCYCVCVGMVRYIVEECDFFYEFYVKYGSAKKLSEKMSQISRYRVPSEIGIHKIICIVCALSPIWTLNLKEMPCAYRRKTRRRRGSVTTHITEIAVAPCTKESISKS